MNFITTILNMRLFTNLSALLNYMLEPFNVSTLDSSDSLK
jgi:hypothetical protein